MVRWWASVLQEAAAYRPVNTVASLLLKAGPQGGVAFGVEGAGTVFTRPVSVRDSVVVCSKRSWG